MHRALIGLTVLTGTASAESLSGTVVNKSDGQPTAGATIIATHPDGKAETAAAITDENGRFKLDVERGTYEITIYYVDSTITLAKNLVVDQDLVFAQTTVDDSYQPIGCVFWDHAPAEMTSYPRLGFAAGRHLHPVSRDRTHRAWIAPAAAADPATAVTTLEGGWRFARAPGIPIAFLTDVTTETTRISIEEAAGSGGAAGVSLRSGSNDPTGDARIVLGLDRDKPSEGAEVFAGGPIKKDKAWGAAGLVAQRAAGDRLSADGMINASYMPNSDQMISLAGLAQGSGDDRRATWSAAKWSAKAFEYKLSVDTVATAEAMTAPVTARPTKPIETGSIDDGIVSRFGAGTGARLHFHGYGHHELHAGIGGGTGSRGEVEHADATAFAGDSWQILPNFTIDAGTRWEARRFGDERTAQLVPRVAVTWDPTKEGRGDLYVAYQRISHLDDGLPGDWRTGALRADELSSGFGYADEHLPVMVGITGLARRIDDDKDTHELGLQSWARIEMKKTTIHAQLASLGHVGTLLAQRTFYDHENHKLIAAASLRATPDHTDAGAAATYRFARSHGRGPSPDLAADLTLEGYAGADGPGGRLLLGMSW